jgi:hypothetical protein
MRSPLQRALAPASLFVVLFATGCAAGPYRGDATDEVVQDWQRLATAREAALTCRETSLAREAELLAIHARDLAAMRQSLQKLSDLTTHSAAIAARLQKAEIDLEAAQREVTEAKIRLASPRAAASAASSDQSADLFVQRGSPNAGDAAYREALRTVQALVDSGKVRATVRNGRVTFVLPRQLDESDPYTAPAGRREFQSFDLPNE